MLLLLVNLTCTHSIIYREIKNVILNINVKFDLQISVCDFESAKYESIYIQKKRV